MLILTRKTDEAAALIFDRDTLQTLLANCPADGHRIEVKIVGVDGTRARVGFNAPKCVAIVRDDAIQTEVRHVAI